MKLRFEADLPHQSAAVEAVCDLFAGQEVHRTEFTVAPAGPQAELALDEEGLGVGNALSLPPETLLANLRAVQVRNALPPAEALRSMDFTVEMETGTGKTYVYLKTIFELNRRFGFTKFVVVVPSVAIREGVAKTLEITREHFRALYAGQPMDWFVYDSAKLGQVRDFAASSAIKVMVATIGALNKLDQNVFYARHERTGGERPVDLVRASRPIVIVDEPQSVDGGKYGKGRQALAEMAPLCTLRYSATHLDKHQMVYRLDAVDAYAQKLVKRIDVAGLEIAGAHDAPYVKLLEVKTAKGRAPEARVELDVQGAGQVLRLVKTVRDGDDLAEITGRSIYADVSIGAIEPGPLLQLNLPGDVRYLRPGEAHGDVGRDAIVRRMIERTIREHFTRELQLRPKGIKVLSLFFIDRVEHYRVHHADGGRSLGPYGRIFEEEYRKLAAHPDFRELFGDAEPDPERAHDGYFSQDRKGRVTEPELNAEGEFRNAASREDAERGFRLIMRDKERLLDEREPLRFIFSHSALREGWDNPNVFQICSLREMASAVERRQTVGRGLRLCVDRHGQRRHDEGVNVLTVIAGESYAAFAEGLQKQIEADLGVRFGVVAPESFAAMAHQDEAGGLAPLGAAKSAALYAELQALGYLDLQGRIEERLRAALSAGAMIVPDAFAPVAAQVRALLTKLAGRLEVRNADARRTIGLDRQVYLGEDFRALWDRIKARTNYRLAFDSEALIADAAGRIGAAPPLPRAQARWRKAQLKIDDAGVATVGETTSDYRSLASEPTAIPDVLGELQNRTQLTRRSLARMLVDSGRLEDLRRNPSAFIDLAADQINKAKAAALAGGVRYQRVGADSYYAQELFEAHELQGYLDKMIEARKAPTEAIRNESGVERSFADAIDANEAVKVIAKLPPWFQVPTPLGGYNPDWAVLVTTESGERLYFVVEAKGAADLASLRPDEAARIRCGERHVAAVAATPVEPAFRMVASAEELLASASDA